MWGSGEGSREGGAFGCTVARNVPATRYSIRGAGGGGWMTTGVALPSSFLMMQDSSFNL